MTDAERAIAIEEIKQVKARYSSPTRRFVASACQLIALVGSRLRTR
jgi:hypothetical protein